MDQNARPSMANGVEVAVDRNCASLGVFAAADAHGHDTALTQQLGNFVSESDRGAV
ncbi:MAG: hypothetical protein M0Z68_10055 [Gammaproteobacteria bacterium]|nr:hypothetical protein [Gammaproteobacteria bacterium]